MKFVILDGFLSNFDEINLEIGAHEQVWYLATEPEQVVERIGDAEGVIVNRQLITREIMEACPNLRFIGILATGYNMVDLDAARERNITVSNVPSYSTGAVAQLTIGLLLDIARHIGDYSRLVADGQWGKGGGREIVAYPTFELTGKTMGIFGAGEIGLAVGRIAEAMGMDTLYYRRTRPANPEGRTYVEADELLARSDVVSLHIPLNKETAGLFDRETIGKMKNGAILLNTARGAILDEEAVREALDSGKLLALGADVLATEPPPEKHPLVGHPKTVITPHVAWLPRETRERLLQVVSQNILAFAAGKPINVVGG